MVRVGVPSGAAWSLEFGAFVFFVSAVFARFGTVTLAALLAVVHLQALALMPALGLANADAILVGNALGAGAHARVPSIVGRTAAMVTAWMLLVGVAYALAPTLLLTAFVRGEGFEAVALRSIAASLLRVAIVWQLLDGLSITLQEALRAAGDTLWPMGLRLAAAWLVFVPLALAGAVVGAGPAAMMGCVVGYVAVVVAALTLRFRAGAWREAPR